MKSVLLSLALLVAAAIAQTPNQLRLCLRHDPKTFDPVLVDEDAGEAIRYLTAGVLIRVNRNTQAFEPELATSWKFSDGGRHVVFQLRERLLFSDGTPFSAEDVAFSFKRMMDPELHSPTGDSFRSGTGMVVAKIEKQNQVSLHFSAPIAGIERLFDQVAIMSCRSPTKEMAGLGPYVVAEYKAGSYVELHRNPNYWKRDGAGKRLPYIDSVRFDIQANREIETLRLQRGEVHMISALDAEMFDRLRTDPQLRTTDAGPSYDNEMLWFNQVRRAPIPEHKKEWFRSQIFRRAISSAVNRSDIARLVFRGHAEPAAGPFSSANQLWFNAKIKADAYNPDQSVQQLKREGFRLDKGQLYDPKGNPVEFSLITNSGAKPRARIASLLQQDLAKIGIRLNIVPLDFPSLIERISRTFNYEACLLGQVNVDADPNGLMNVWLSSATNHQWNPSQKAPETSWEAEIDRLMRSQSSSMTFEIRRRSFNRVQEIVAEQVPFIFLVTKNSLVSVSSHLRGVTASAMRPQLYWNVEHLYFDNLDPNMRAQR
jgi:peptide/nickel transport system substrate-binding protein